MPLICEVFGTNVDWKVSAIAVTVSFMLSRVWNDTLASVRLKQKQKMGLITFNHDENFARIQYFFALLNVCFPIYAAYGL